jgi:hypothetical protein
MNNYIAKGNILEVTVDSPTVPTSGVPCRFGSLVGFATLNEGEGGVSAATKTMVDFGGGIYDTSVTDTATGGIAVGAQLYFHDANPPLINNVAASGYSVGIALQAIGSGLTDTINVLHIPRFGLGTTPADTTVTTAKLVADNVTAAKLTATLRTGFIPIDLFSAHVIGANAIAAQVGAASDPLLKRFNGATDIAASISWESASVIEIQFPTIPYPPDLDDTADVDVHLLAKMLAGSVNTPVLTVKAFEGQGGADIGAATAALSTTMQDLKVALATAGISAHPNCLSIGVTPGAHNTASNDVRLYGAWLEYTRK